MAISPHARPLFKITPEVIKDSTFQSWLKDSLVCWKQIKDRGLGILKWWDIVVKPGIKKLAIQRSKEITKDQRGALNLLFLRQIYFEKKKNPSRSSGETR